MERKIWLTLALPAIALALVSACGCNPLEQAFETISNMDDADMDDQSLFSDDEEACDSNDELPEYWAPEDGTCRGRDKGSALLDLLQDDEESCD